MALLAYWNLTALPYAEYWIPLAIGVGIGFTFLVMARGLFGWRPRVAPPPAPDPAKGFDPFVHGSPTEQRKSFRRTGSSIEVFYALPENKSRPQMGWVFDRSVGGVGLVVSEEMAEGLVLAVRPATAPDIVPWVDVEVRSCRPSSDGKGFDLGCKFVKTPPWSVLLMFG